MTIEMIKAMFDACYLAGRTRAMLPALPEGVTSSYIHYLDVIDSLERQGLRVRVSDIGEKLGCGAVMTALRRTKANGFPIDGCITLDELAELAQSGKIEEKIIPIEQALDSYRFVTVTEPQARRFKNGGELSLERLYLKAPQENELVRVIAPGNEFLGMGEVADGEIKVKRLLIK